MRSFRVIGAFIIFSCIGLSSSAFAQEEKTGYFSLNSSRTYAPGQKVSIDMWAQNVDTLEFRVYRVNDPVKLFVQLGDAHQFGGRAPRPPHKLTWLERLHSWKRDIFVWIRDFFRAQAGFQPVCTQLLANLGKLHHGAGPFRRISQPVRELVRASR